LKKEHGRGARATFGNRPDGAGHLLRIPRPARLVPRWATPRLRPLVLSLRHAAVQRSEERAQWTRGIARQSSPAPLLAPAPAYDGGSAAWAGALMLRTRLFAPVDAPPLATASRAVWAPRAIAITPVRANSLIP
jgi:hypothetical protein